MGDLSLVVSGTDAKLEQPHSMDVGAQEVVGQKTIARATLELGKSCGCSPRIARTNLYTS